MVQDPRTHITPEAFGLAPDLLGLALAPPSRRLVAIVIDLGLAALIARTGVELLIAAAAGLIAWRAIGGPADRLLARRGGRLVFRAASAILALIIVVNIWDGAADWLGSKERQAEARARTETAAAASDEAAVVANDDTEADDAENVASKLEELGLSGADRGAFLLMFASLEMADGNEAAAEGAELGRWVRERTSPGATQEEFAAALAGAMKPAVRDSFLHGLGGGPAEQAAVPADSQAQPATDSIQLLTEANGQLRERNAALTSALERQREEDENRGVRGWLGNVSDDLGLGFGWFALYFTAFTVLGRGQTPGKRLLRIKVLQLDNRPIGWWVAFERFGGYAASFSIGLLGFAQILWDRNRQALHDKAVGTVVVQLRGGQPFRIG